MANSLGGALGAQDARTAEAVLRRSRPQLERTMRVPLRRIRRQVPTTPSQIPRSEPLPRASLPLATFDRAKLSVDVFFLDGFALVVIFSAFDQSNLNLRSALFEIDLQRNATESPLAQSIRDLIEFHPIHQ